jgi:dihydrodipicolinate synthase/N-acetylneuraminate lyase
MKKLNSNNLRGNWATLLLPIKADNSIDFSALANEIDQLIAVGVDGIYSNGTAGEFHNQTESEFDRVSELLAEKCSRAKMRFQIGASHPSPWVSLERLKRSVHLRPDAFQVILPDWVAASAEEQITFLQGMEAEADGIPLVLYNPPHAKSKLEPKDYQQFEKAVPSLIGVKLLSKEGAWVDEMKQFASYLSVFVPGHFLASGVKAGIADGAYSNVACINPAAAQKLWHTMQEDIDEALRIEQHILEFFRICIAPYQQQGYSNPALDKFLAAVGGAIQIPTRLRWPYKWIAQNEVEAARKVAKSLIPEFF